MGNVTFFSIFYSVQACKVEVLVILIYVFSFNRSCFSKLSSFSWCLLVPNIPPPWLKSLSTAAELGNNVLCFLNKISREGYSNNWLLLEKVWLVDFQGVIYTLFFFGCFLEKRFHIRFICTIFWRHRLIQFTKGFKRFQFIFHQLPCLCLLFIFLNPL